MRRREFIGLLGGVAGVLTCADVFAAQKSPLARIGILSTGTFQECNSSHPELFQDPPCLLARELRALGWREGENLQIERRFADGDRASLPRWAAELVSLRPDVLIGYGSSEAKALKEATSDIPIVFMNSSDPVRYGLVDSIARPGKNVTGTAVAPQILWGKRLELVVELLGHKPAKIAWLSDPGDVATKLNEAAVMQPAEKLGIEVERWQVREPEDLERVFANASGSEAVLVQFVTLTIRHRQQIADLAARYRLPAIYDNREFVVDGGLISYGADQLECWRQSLTYVDRILRGAQPKDLPVEQASKFVLSINLKTANALGITVPPMLLARADEVIE
jgi:putative tryptophan/tyrosine transport system substrate-binding protein